MFLVAVCFDAAQCNAAGVIKASGRQGLGSVCSLCCMLFLALPIGYFAAFYLHLGLCGLWLAYGFSAFVLSLLYATILVKMDWHKTAEEASSSESDEFTQSSTSNSIQVDDDDDFKRVYYDYYEGDIQNDMKYSTDDKFLRF